MNTPTKNTLNLLRKKGFSVTVVERWNAFARIRQDAFHFGDILAFNTGGGLKGVWLIQATSDSNHSARVKKSISIPELRGWLDSGGRFAVISWKKVKNRWVPKIQEIEACQLDALMKDLNVTTNGLQDSHVHTASNDIFANLN